MHRKESCARLIVRHGAITQLSSLQNERRRPTNRLRTEIQQRLSAESAVQLESP